MPIVHIYLLEGRPEEKIQGVIREVTDTISTVLGSPKENVRVIVSEVPKSHWGVAGIPMSDKQ
ncbi:4-oxalocrotonate tautomerase [Geobacillus sp. BMUD]|nr:4-oxalocrotonate tautomerase [Geobacillus sp. BMUD]NNV08038.1 4-oxalocrotonate tautomerase [Geobacillus sp. MMMUD3]TWG30319.1 4-oxalocrotonate tautomerase [Geobacillus sp. C56-T2]